MRYRILIVILTAVLVVTLIACDGDNEQETGITQETSSASIEPTETPTATIAPPITDSPLQTDPPECALDIAKIQVALDAYYAEMEIWPTLDGNHDEIVWWKLVPEWLDEIPSTVNCKWSVNTNPEGKVCRPVSGC